MENENKISIIWQNAKLLLFDIVGAMGVSFTLEEFIIGSIHWVFAVSATVAGGSLLFLAQKTILPVIANRINSLLQKWFDKGTKAE